MKIETIKKIKTTLNVICLAIMFTGLVCFISLILTVITIYHYEKDRVGYINTTSEKAFFEGQRSILEGDTCIVRDGNVYKWIKSPWENGDVPVLVIDSSMSNRESTYPLLKTDNGAK